MPNYGRITFWNARASGIELKQLGSGNYDFVRFAGPNGVNSAISVNNYQDTTFITDDQGNTPSPLGGSGYMTNCKLTSSTTVQISGLPLGPYDKSIVDVNIFEVGNLLTEPFFTRIPSGSLLIRYDASGVAAVHTYNAKIYAFDSGGSVNDAYTDATILGFEINASGKFKDVTHSGVWKELAGSNNAMQFVDHSPANGYRARNLHLWVVALTARPNVVGVLDDIRFGFSLQYN